MRRAIGLGSAVLAAGLMVGDVSAVPYPSGVTQDGDDVTFVLNEEAVRVVIRRDGGNEIVIANAARGEHSFSMAGFSDYTISVATNAEAGWASEADPSLNRISDPSNMYTHFSIGNGVAVNKNPASENFGRIYVANGGDASTTSGRTMGDGVYILKADQTDLGGLSANDPAAARNGGLEFGGTNNSPFKLGIGPDDTLYIGDWSDNIGGIKYANADVTDGDLLLADAGGDTGLANSVQNHGSIVSSISVSGSLDTGDLTVWAMDEDLEGNTSGTGNHVWRWDVGGSAPSSVAPTLVTDMTDLGTNSDGTPIILDLNIGVSADVWRDPNSGKFYVTQPRDNGTESGLVVLDTDGSTILFNSKQFSIDNNLDGFEDDLGVVPSLGINDVFRYTGAARVSPDGKWLALHRRLDDTTNPFLNGGRIVLVPLDENGVPDIDETLDGVITVFNGDTAGYHIRADVEFDAAGNVYIIQRDFTSSPRPEATEWLQVFGPGGNTLSVLTSDGTFTTARSTVTGDADLDGDVDAFDLGIWQTGFGTQEGSAAVSGDFDGDGDTDAFDLGLWQTNFGTGQNASIPEPATLGLLMLGGLAALRRRR